MQIEQVSMVRYEVTNDSKQRTIYDKPKHAYKLTDLGPTNPRVWILNIPKRLLIRCFFEEFDLELVKNNQKISVLHIEIDQGAMYLSIVSLV